MLDRIGREIDDTDVVRCSPLTIVFKSKISVGVISEGSTNGRGLFEDLRICNYDFKCLTKHTLMAIFYINLITYHTQANTTLH